MIAGCWALSCTSEVDFYEMEPEDRETALQALQRIRLAKEIWTSLPSYQQQQELLTLFDIDRHDVWSVADTWDDILARAQRISMVRVPLNGDEERDAMQALIEDALACSESSWSYLHPDEIAHYQRLREVGCWDRSTVDLLAITALEATLSMLIKLARTMERLTPGDEMVPVAGRERLAAKLEALLREME